MSRYATTIFGIILMAHLVGYASSIMAERENSSSLSSLDDSNPDNEPGVNGVNDNKRSHDYLLDGQATNLRAPQAHQSTKNLDLIELTPSLEQQLYQAKRLNSGDPGSVMELAKLVNDAYRYDFAGESNRATESRPSGAQSRLGRQWMDGVQMLDGARRLNGNNDDELQRRFSRGLTTVYGRAESPSAAGFGREHDRDYGTLVSVPSTQLQSSESIDNQESASRQSLWTSELLRDLLIAQEARNRARFIEKLARAYGREQGANQNPISAIGQSAATASNREKRRRCKVDPNLGVKNPSFCDTDAYFGAADYSMRDVWDSAGR